MKKVIVKKKVMSKLYDQSCTAKNNGQMICMVFHARYIDCQQKNEILCCISEKCDSVPTGWNGKS